MKPENESHIYERRRLRLSELVREKGTQKALSDAVGIAETVISRMLYPEGKKNKRNIGEKSMRIIEDALGLPNGWMDGMVDKEPANVSNFKPYTKGVRYPVLSSVQAGAWSEAIEAYTLKDIDLWLESDAHVQGDAFWLEVDGDSMTAPMGLSIPEGTFVLFDTGRDAINGSLVIAKLSDSNEATFKKLVVDGGQRYLKGLNPQWPLVTINGNCRIIGVAIETKMRLI